MRYAQRGGYTPEEQERGERLRMQAAERFARGQSIGVVAEEFRVTVPTVRRWRRQWREGGAEALRSRGPVPVERLPGRRWVCLEQELRLGPGAHGFTDEQRWTLKRVRTLADRACSMSAARCRACGSFSGAAGGRVRCRCDAPSSGTGRRSRCGRSGCGRG
ncbi:helix-turn-helix domain-containing protein [Streptomyces sp. NPDC001817]|uniref:helix-turn-helix domain-containing protein n=1 Tax=Streptomyces sp. NPDC001817 TaxID=3154398 RepID=UPI0033271DA8